MVVSYIVTFEVKSDDSIPEVKAKLVEFATAYKKDQGTLDWFVSQDAKSPRKFAIVERYESKAAIKTHAANPIFPKFGKFLQPHLSAAPSLSLYNELGEESKL